MATKQDDTLVADQEPRPPFPRQHQTGPGLESKLRPRPRYRVGLKPDPQDLRALDSRVGKASALLDWAPAPNRCAH